MAPTAIIGGGIASCCLALFLAKKQQNIHFFCQDNQLAQGASSNKQAALYPLLSLGNEQLSYFFQQGLYFSRALIKKLNQNNFPVAHDFCGVLQTAWDNRSQKKLHQLLCHKKWPQTLVQAISKDKINQLTQTNISKGLFYPLGGWVNPQELALAAFNYANCITEIILRLNCQITHIEYKNNNWYLITNTKTFGPYKQLVLANGAGINGFEQTQLLQLSAYRGQVTYIPTSEKLNKLSTVICSKGYITPSHQQYHTLGASYIKDQYNLLYRHHEQISNVEKMQQSFSTASWLNDIDISKRLANTGIRMVSRDHFPFMGIAPNIEQLRKIQALHYKAGQKSHCQQYWQHHAIPTYPHLYLLGGFGSRGVTSAPITAKALANIMCTTSDHSNVLSPKMINLLNPNRYWLTKVMKGLLI